MSTVGVRAPTLSVVVPTYAGRKSIRSTVQSLLLDPSDDFELIVVTDGPEEATLNHLRDVEDERLRVVANPKAGASATRNRGLALAQHDWVGFLDDDDLPRSNWLSVWRNHAAGPAYVITAGALRHAGKESELRPSRLEPHVTSLDASALLAGTFWLRTDLARDVGGYDERLRFSENLDLGLRICDRLLSSGDAWRIRNIPDIVIDVRVEPQQARRQRYGAAQAEAAQRLLIRHGPRFKEDPATTAAYHRIISRGLRQSGDLRESVVNALTACRVEPLRAANLRNLLLTLMVHRPTLGGKPPKAPSGPPQTPGAADQR